MEPIVIGRKEFRDKVFACWMGKNIGGTLGAPIEGLKHTHALDFYHPVPDKSAPNDDLDLQLVWLKMLEEQGLDPALPLFAEYWSRLAASYPWDEYGFFMRNHSRGLRPPIAGCFENFYVDNMGSPIRSEIWACLHPGDPEAAARMAWKDSAVDHAGGEGMWGEMFWAALESAAFVESDPLTLIRIGLEMIPLSSHVARSIREAAWCHENGKTWGVARERIATWFTSQHPCNAVPNHGFTIIGWLYGADYGDRLTKAVNCGFDTDCTGATLGSLLGILGGTAAIPKKWSDPIGTQIVVHKFTRNFTPPPTIDDLTDRTVALAVKAAAAKTHVAFGDGSKRPADTLSRLFRNPLARAAAAQDIHASVELTEGKEVALHFGGEPVLRPGIAREVFITVSGATVPADLLAPKGWECERLAPNRFRLFSAGPVADRNVLTVRSSAGETRFTMLGPAEAKGWPAGDNVPKCPKCHARVEACICPK